MTYEVSRFIAKNLSFGGAPYTVQEVTALNYVVSAMKLYGLWPAPGSSSVIYPFVGSTAIQQSINLNNPDSYRLSWFNDNTAYHTSTGYTADYGNRAYANTGLPPTVFGRLQSFNVYARTIRTANSNGPDIASSTAGTRRLYCLINNDNANPNNVYLQAYSGSGESISTTVTTRKNGLYTYNVNNGTNSIWKDGVQLVSGSVAVSTAVPTPNICLGNETTNVAGGNNSSGNEYSWLHIGPLLTASNQAIYYQIIQNFQTILGRNI